MNGKVLCLFVSILLLVSCAHAEESKVTSVALDKQVLTFAEATSIPTMDTTQATDTVSFTTMNNVFEGLYRLDQNNQLVEGVASRHEVSEDGLIYTFTIRDDAVWSNGEAVTAHDFVYAWRKAVHPETLSPYSYIMNTIRNASRIQDAGDSLYGKVEQLGVQAMDDTTLQVTLENPIPYFLSLTAFPTFFPQKEAFVMAQGNHYALDAESLLFNGPFTLVDWKQEQGWTYKKNPNYWDQTSVKLDEVHFIVVKEATTVTRLYETGDIDRASLAAEYVDLYADHEDFRTNQYSSVSFLRLNQKNEALANVNIRKAIANAWDKDAIAKVLLNNGSQPAYYYVPPEFVTGPQGHDFRDEKEYLHEGVKRAKVYWKQGLEELGKQSVTLELLTYDSENSSIISQFIKNQLETNLEGLTITIKPQPFSQKMVLENALDYDLSFSGWGPDYADPMTFLDIFISGSSNNNMAYSNAHYDQLLQQASVEFTDLERRFGDMKEAERILLEEDAAIVPMFQSGSAYLQRSYIKDLIVHPYGPGKSFKWAYIDE